MVLYVPDTRGLDSGLVKDQLLQKIASMKDLTGFNHSFETKEEQMFFLIKHNDDQQLQEAKRKIVPMMKSVIAEMRGPGNVSTSDKVKADAINNSTRPGDANNSGTDLTPLQASSEDFLNIMGAGGPENDDKQQKIRAHISEVPPQDPKIIATADRIKPILQASTLRQRKCYATASLGRASGIPSKRPRGVFPAGVQPNKVVVVVDDAIPHLNVDEIRKKGYDVLTGSNLDVQGLSDLIAGNDHYSKDGVLYVVQPGLDFFLKNMQVVDLEVAHSSKNENLGADPKKIIEQLSTLINKDLAKVPQHLESKTYNTYRGIFNITFESLSVLKKCDVSKLGKSREFSCSSTSVESCLETSTTSGMPQHEDLDCKNLLPSNKGPSNDEASKSEEKPFSSPTESNEEDNVPVPGYLQTFVSRALHLALVLRNSVLVNTLNSEVVFLGYPVEWLLADGAEKVFPKLPEVSLKDLTGSLIAALRLFNIFAAKTWKLGGFPSLNFNNDPAVSVDECVHETKKPNVRSRLGPLVVPEPVKGAANNAKEVHEETSNESKDESTMQAMEAEDIGGERSAEDDLINCSVDALTYEENAHDGDDDGDCDAPCSRFVSEKESSKSSDLDDPVGSRTTRQTETEGIDCDVEDQEELLCELESEGDAIECLNVEAIATAAAKTTPSTATSGGSQDDCFDLSLLKLVCVIKRDVTSDVTRVLDFVSNHYQMNGSFPPWTRIRGAPCSPSIHLSLVEEYVRTLFYLRTKHHTDTQDKYRCAVTCKSKNLMDAAEAEAHAFTRRHVALLVKTGANAKQKQTRCNAKYLRDEAVKKHGTPVAPDQIEQLIKLGLMEQLEKGGEQLYKCLLCPLSRKLAPGPYDGASLRSHLHTEIHMIHLKKALGIEGRFNMDILENWETIKRGFRYSSMDVVIVADNMHRPALTAFIDMHPQVHVITVDNLIHEESAPWKVLSRWQEIVEARKAATGKRPRALFLIVTGKDLMLRPSKPSTGEKFPSKVTDAHWKEKKMPEQEVVVVKNEVDVGYQGDCGGEALKSSEQEQKVQEEILLRNLNKTMAEQGSYNEAVTDLVRTHSFFRVKLPADCKVLVTPSLPLTLLSDTTPQPAKAKVIQHKHSVLVPPHMAQAVSKAYLSISDEVYSIHRANSIQENVLRVDKTFALEHTDVTEKINCLLSSQWHVTVEGIILNALRGMPSVIPNFTAGDGLNLDLLRYHTHLYQVAVVGDYAEWIQHVKRSSKRCVEKPDQALKLIPRKGLMFHKADMDFILEKAKLLPKDRNGLVWYLTCPLPEILFRPKKCRACIKTGCETHLNILSSTLEDKCDHTGLDKVSHLALMKVSAFMTRLQSKLPLKHFVTLFPMFPTNIICYDANHADMHKLQDVAPCTSFIPMSASEILKPIAIRFANGWLELFRKVHLGHTDSFKPCSFKYINVQDNQITPESLMQYSTQVADYWIRAVNMLIKDHHIGIRVEFTPIIAAWLHGEGPGPPFHSSDVFWHKEMKPERVDCREVLNRIKIRDQEPPTYNEHQLPFGRIDEQSYGHGGPHGGSFSSGNQTTSLQFEGSPIRRRGPATYQLDPFQRTGSPPGQGFNPAAIRSRSPSHGSRTYMRLDGPPHHKQMVDLTNKNPVGRDFGRPYSNQEKRSRSPERRHYSPRRGMAHSPRRFPGEGGFSESQERRPPNMGVNKFSAGPQPSKRGRFHSSPPRARFNADLSEEISPWESSSDKTVMPFVGATGGGPATPQFVFTVATASREPLSQYWISKLAWAFKITAQPTPGPRGSWRVHAPSARALFGAQRFLPAVRLVDQQLIVTMETSQSVVVPVTSLEEEELYRQQLEFVVRCYNDDHTPKLVHLLMDDTSATFFRPGWQDLYTPDLSRTIPIVADAMRSLSLIPRSEAGSVRLLVVTPSADAVGVITRALHAVGAPLGITLAPIVHGKEDIGPGMTVVVGAAIPLAQVCSGLTLQDLSALVVDDATVFLDDPTPKEALLAVLSIIGSRTRDYSSINKVAVARDDSYAERSRMEAMLECVFAGGCSPPQLPQPRLVEPSISLSEHPWLKQVNDTQHQLQSYLKKQEEPLPRLQAQFQERYQQEPFTSKQNEFGATHGSGPELKERQNPQFKPRHEQFDCREKQWEPTLNRFKPHQEQSGPRQNWFESQQEKFSARQNQFNPQKEQFGSRQNPFKPQQDQFQSGQSHINPRQEQFESSQNQYQPQQEKFESRQKPQNQFKPHQKQSGSRQNQFMPQQERFESMQNQFKPQQEQSGSRQNQFKPQQEQFASMQNQFEPQQEEFGSGQKQFKPQQEQSGSRQNTFRPQQERFESMQNQLKPQQEQFESSQYQFKPQQEQFAFMQNQFKPQQEQFESSRYQFKPHQK